MFSEVVVFQVSLLVGVILLSCIITRVRGLIRRREYEEDVLRLFYICWDGTPEDELYAWIKVRNILKRRDREEQKILFVEQKLADLDRIALYGNMTVSESGELIDQPANPKTT